MDANPTTEPKDDLAAPNKSSSANIDDRNMRSLQRHFLQAVSSTDDKEIMINRVTALLATTVDSVHFIYYERNNHQQLQSTGTSLPEISSEISYECETLMRNCCEVACQQKQLYIEDQDVQGQWSVIAVPVALHNAPVEAFAILCRSKVSRTDRTTAIVQMAAAHCALWHVIRSSQEQISQYKNEAALMNMLRIASTKTEFRDICSILVDRVKNYLGCDQVVLGLCKNSRIGVHHSSDCTLTAISGVKRWRRQSKRFIAIQKALEEVIQRDEITSWPPESCQQEYSAVAHRHLSALCNDDYIISSPLRDHSGKAVGAWIFLGVKDFSGWPHVRQFAQAAEANLAEYLSCLARVQFGFFGYIFQLFKHVLTHRRTLYSCFAILLLAAVLSIPKTYQTTCNWQLRTDPTIGTPSSDTIIDVEIPDDDLRFVDPTKNILVRLGNDESKTLTGQIRYIYPRAELRGKKHVYLAEVSLDTGGEQLRNCTMGRAVLYGPRYSIAWNLKQKMKSAATAFLGW